MNEWIIGPSSFLMIPFLEYTNDQPHIVLWWFCLLSHRMCMYFTDINTPCVASVTTWSIRSVKYRPTHITVYVVPWANSVILFFMCLKAKFWIVKLLQSKMTGALVREKGSGWPPVVKWGNGFKIFVKYPDYVSQRPTCNMPFSVL